MILVGQRGLVCHPREDLHCWLHPLCSLPGLRYFLLTVCGEIYLHCKTFTILFLKLFIIFTSRAKNVSTSPRQNFSQILIILSVLCGLDCLRWQCGKIDKIRILSYKMELSRNISHITLAMR